MDVRQYWKNKLPVVLLNLFGMLSLTLFLLAGGVGMQSILFIALVWGITVICYLAVLFFLRKRYLDGLLTMAEQLTERYLIAEVMQTPERADDRVFHQLMKLGEKSMLEKIGRVEQERREYREYIEQWIHEAKTPIAAMKLLCENNRSDFTRKLLAELEHMNHYTEQALYYARSEHTQRDYSIREMNLEEVVHNAIADHKYLLRQNAVTVTVDEMDDPVYSDDKWVRFILGQLIDNAVKYRAKQPELHFYAVKRGEYVSLVVADNGVGIAAGDLPRVFDKGFTGSNGRAVYSSTGIGLYLCKRLCDKLGIGLEVASEGEGTKATLSFQIDDFIAEVQK
ncbi:MAG: sensor histidine kinase [Ruminococcus flavefaciens]|nr:sensor histidine kinase [Ruminococcus flavefaciens]